MAIAYIKEIGQAQQGGASTTLAVTAAAAAGAAGNLLVARVNVDNAQTLSSVTDTRGNAWLIAIQTSAGPCAAIAYTMQNVGAIQIGDTITFTLGSTTSQTNAIIDEFSGIVLVSPLDQTATGSAVTTNRSGGTTAITTQAVELVVGCFVVPGTETTFTAGAGYLEFTTKFRGVNSSVEGCYQIVAATATYNPNGTGDSFSTKGCTATFKGVIAATVNTFPRATSRSTSW